MTLMRAYAAFRAGEPAAGALAARAFEQVAAIEQPTLPLLKEADLVAQLLGLAIETGKPAALALQSSSERRHLSVLGRLEVTVGGRPAALPRGQGVQLLGIVALHRRIPVELVIASLWPEADLESGRNRLRTVLNRLRSDSGDLVERDGEVLVLARDVTVDLEQFDADVRRVLALRHDDLGSPPPWTAPRAMARYHGSVLPDELDRPGRWSHASTHGAACSTSWHGAQTMRRRAATSTRSPSFVRAIEVDPHDDELYLRAATVLLDQGRRGEARSVSGARAQRSTTSGSACRQGSSRSERGRARTTHADSRAALGPPHRRTRAER